MILGIHCSVMRGFSAALKEAEQLSCEAMQMLPYRRHHDPSDEEIVRFRAERAASGVSRLAVHSRFVPSLGSTDPERRKRSVELLAYELGLAWRLGAEMFICHAGAYSAGEAEENGARLVVESLCAAAAQAGNPMPIGLENVAGGGRRLGGILEELARLFEGVAAKGIQTAICLDTAHAWAAGYDISSAAGMEIFLERAERLFGPENIRMFHLNDSMAPLGSHRENHCHWGDGLLGSEGLGLLLSRAQYSVALGILETPKGPGLDRKNLDYVRGLI